MTPAKKCNESGLTLTQLSQFSGVNKRTLENWFKNRKYVFDAVLHKAATEKAKMILDKDEE